MELRNEIKKNLYVSKIETRVYRSLDMLAHMTLKNVLCMIWRTVRHAQCHVFHFLSNLFLKIQWWHGQIRWQYKYDREGRQIIFPWVSAAQHDYITWQEFVVTKDYSVPHVSFSHLNICLLTHTFPSFLTSPRPRFSRAADLPTAPGSEPVFASVPFRADSRAAELRSLFARAPTARDPTPNDACDVPGWIYPPEDSASLTEFPPSPCRTEAA